MQVPIQPLPRSPSPLALPTSNHHVRLPPSPASPIRPRSAQQIPPPGKDIPWRLLIPVTMFRISDAMSFVVLFPIITDMITSFDVPQDRIGFYAGLGEGVLMLVEALVATTWARLADRWGRKPCIVWGQAVALTAAGMVGFSTKVWHVVVWRALLGLGPCGVLNKILASEISNPSNRSRIFAIFSPAFSVGMLMGTFLGGQLAHPYGRLPWWLGGASEFWRRWPFALPNVTSALFGIATCVYGQFTLVETRPPQKHAKDVQQTEKGRQPGSLTETLKVPGFLLITVIFCAFQITNFAYDGIFTVYTYTPVAHGGLGLPVDTIGLIYSYGAALYIVIVPTLLPPLQNRLGERRLLEVVFGAWLIVSLLIPLAQWTAANMRWMMWVVVLGSQTLKCFAAFAWPMCDILTMNTLQDHPDLLATGSAISLIAGAFGRAIGPSLSGWIFSMSTQYERGSIGRQISWMSMLAFSVPPMICVMFLKDTPAHKEGYESVPLAHTEREEDDEMSDDDEPRRAKATASDV